MIPSAEPAPVIAAGLVAWTGAPGRDLAVAAVIAVLILRLQTHQRRSSMRISISVLAVAATLPIAAALAQQSQSTEPSQQMHGPMMGQGMMERGMMPMMEMMAPAQHIEGRLAFLKTELQITDAQMPQWNVFSDALRANAKSMSDLRGTSTSNGMMGPGQNMMRRSEMMSGQAGTGMSLPDRLDRAEQHMAAYLEMLRAMKGPTTQLYAVLSDDQKRLADQLIRGPMGIGMM
jgi:hypothetical protein